MGYGITFDDKYHTYKDWGLRLLSINIPSAPVKESLINIPGRNGSIDLTDFNGGPFYSDRDGIEIVFDLLDGSFSAWLTIVELISSVINGKKLKMVIDDEINRYYIVRLNVNTQKSDPIMSQITLTGKAEPFKNDIETTADSWLWDPFNFRTGIIQSFNNIAVNNGETLNITIIGKGVGSVPKIFVSKAENLFVTFDDNSFLLCNGENYIPELKIRSGEKAELKFTGTGIVTIDYRGVYL